MTSRKRRHGLEDKWTHGGVYFTLCRCGRLLKHETPADAKAGMKDHITEAARG